jgi:putative membrane protein
MKIRNRHNKIPASIQHIMRGVFMGVADVVPGVSGGTIALLLGIYERLIRNVHDCSDACLSFLRKDFKESKRAFSKIEWRFLAPLFMGIFVSFGMLAQVIERLLEDYPRSMAGFFFGLVLASIVAAISMIEIWKFNYFLWIPVTTVVAFLLLGLRAGPIEEPSLLVFFISGAIAICAMVLPGVSGSFLLLMIGMYGSLIDTINNRYMLELMVFGAGSILSLGLSVRVLNWLLARFRDLLLAFLIGLMIGSLRVIWPWPNGVGVVSENENEIIEGSILAWPDSFVDFLWPTVFGITGFVIVIGIWNLERRK